MKSITIFTIPKEFVDPHVTKIQTNAILSWKNIGLDVILMGDDKGVDEFAKKHGLKHLPDIARNEHNTPLLSWAFKKANEVSNSDVLTYSNADIIFTSEFIDAINSIDMENFLAVGQRLDFEQDEYIDFSDEDWENKITEKVNSDSKLHAPTGIDHFSFPNGNWADFPEFAVGRAGWDNWFVYTARKKHINVIDLTPTYKVFHQNHGHSKKQRVDGKWAGAEFEKHKEMIGEMHKIMDISDSKYELKDNTIKRKKVGLSKMLYYIAFTPEIFNKNIPGFVTKISSKLYTLAKLFKGSN